MVKLGESRGIETPSTKLFMRLSAVISDVIVYFPAVIAFCAVYYKGYYGNLTAMVILLLQPALVLIDHGHFQ